jgi:N-formylglutamate amidohydrolase
MILHIPHSSRNLDGLVELQNEKENLDFLTDTYTKELFGGIEYKDIIFPYSRFVCDVERFINDPMENKGQGIIYTKDNFGADIKRNISDEDVMKMYKEHHVNFNIKVNGILPYFSKYIIVDCHSFTPDKNSKDIDICIGTDDFHTPAELVRLVFNNLTSKGYNLEINNPFSGTIVPSQHYKKNKDVYSIMIEVNKNIYLNENFKKVKEDIEDLKKDLKDYEINIA